jgi:hypothetical protein
MPDCGPQPGGTFPALGLSVILAKLREREGGRQGGTAAELLMKLPQNVCQNIIFLRSCQKFKEIQKTFMQEWVFKKSSI